MWWWRKIRPAKIPPADRQDFERFGETVVGYAVLFGDRFPSPSPLYRVYTDYQTKTNAMNWLAERADANERREQRLETVEWAILIFVAVGVIADIVLLLHH